MFVQSFRVSCATFPDSGRTVQLSLVRYAAVLGIVYDGARENGFCAYLYIMRRPGTGIQTSEVRLIPERLLREDSWQISECPASDAPRVDQMYSCMIIRVIRTQPYRACSNPFGKTP
ncbi:hypothetical protein M413DRAFT_447117 [Hebeloma cylindrosporum]|uniref:Uncharacterized protein n=1 Tax=Hebeloma cylindrosporum TaxID=76867 RepID=A0A0C3BSL9_HEBCY|nr:hypothetical protein M413DRAFT_447117 [Hebeloma cylindrosporum h7]